MVYFDLETNGLLTDSGGGRILELAAWCRPPEGAAQPLLCETLVNPGPSVVIHPGAFRAHGITARELQDPGVPGTQKALRLLEEFVARCAELHRRPQGSVVELCAHNATSFDSRVLCKEYALCQRAMPPEWLFLDTLTMARKHFPGRVDRKLGTLFTRFQFSEADALSRLGGGGGGARKAHRAGFDCAMLACVHEALEREMGHPPNQLSAFAFPISVPGGGGGSGSQRAKQASRPAAALSQEAAALIEAAGDKEESDEGEGASDDEGAAPPARAKRPAPRVKDRLSALTDVDPVTLVEGLFAESWAAGGDADGGAERRDMGVWAPKTLAEMAKEGKSRKLLTQGDATTLAKLAEAGAAPGRPAVQFRGLAERVLLNLPKRYQEFAPFSDRAAVRDRVQGVALLARPMEAQPRGNKHVILVTLAVEGVDAPVQGEMWRVGPPGYSTGYIETRKRAAAAVSNRVRYRGQVDVKKGVKCLKLDTVEAVTLEEAEKWDEGDDVEGEVSGLSGGEDETDEAIKAYADKPFARTPVDGGSNVVLSTWEDVQTTDGTTIQAKKWDKLLRARPLPPTARFPALTAHAAIAARPRARDLAPRFAGDAAVCKGAGAAARA